MFVFNMPIACVYTYSRISTQFHTYICLYLSKLPITNIHTYISIHNFIFIWECITTKLNHI